MPGHVLGALAQFERELIVERTRRCVFHTTAGALAQNAKLHASKAQLFADPGTD